VPGISLHWGESVVSTYVLMRILESAPSRYDRGLRILTWGRLEEVYDRLATHVEPGRRVLDLGCGTGALSLRAAARGALVKGIDVNSQMLEMAHQRAQKAGLGDLVEFVEMGIAELDGEESEAYDAVTSALCFSELTEDEQSYALRESRRLLKPGGLLLLADEVVPRTPWKRLLNATVRLPLALLAYLWTQTTTHAVRDLPGKVTRAGFVVESTTSTNLESLLELIAAKPG
jgi:demethylmenaquinone methyltransferase/2-methoxy-6-polyprenyl-1,4-benzoquinol methylase